MFALQRVSAEHGSGCGFGPDDFRSLNGRRATQQACLVLGALVLVALALASSLPAQKSVSGQSASAAMNTPPQSLNLPPRVMQAQRFLARRGWTQARNKIWTNWRAGGRAGSARPGLPMSAQGAQAQTPATATWQPLGPTAVTSSNFGLVTGRVSALALDPSDATGNHLYVGTTGGGVWAAQNAGAASTSSITFTPLTDSLGGL
jgi:hypothetical protein